MKMKALALCCTVVLLLAACSSQKVSYTAAEKAQLEEMVTAKTFRLRAQWANPLATTSVSAIVNSGLLLPGSSPNRIDIMSTTAYLEVSPDSVSAQLPYYGERQIANTYNPADVGIQFNGAPEDLKIKYNEKKDSYYFSFDIVNDLGEGFNVNGTLFPNLKTNFYINSTQRFTIGYFGVVMDTEKEELQ